MSWALLTAAVVGLAANVGVDLALRKGRARSASRGPHDRGSSALLALLATAAIPGSILFLLFGDPGRFRIGLPEGWTLVALLAGGTALRVWSMRELGEYFTRTLAVSDRQGVVDSGPYRWLRHPGYLAQLVVVTSISTLFAQSWVAFVLVFFGLGAGYVYRIQVEESMLIAEMGEAYESYRLRTWRLLPGLY